MGKMFLLYALLSVIAINNVLASNTSACPKGSLSCDDRQQCVTSDKWCNKIDDCEDKSDEARCKKSSWWPFANPNSCLDIHFLCSSGICIPKSARCNDHDDCRDYSDEVGCEEESTTQKVITTKTHKSAEITAEVKEDVSEEAENPDKKEDETAEEQDYDEDILVASNNAIMPSSLSTESSSVFSSSTQDYYRRRMKETDAPKQVVSSQTSNSFTQGYRTPVTTPASTVTPSNVFVRSASPEYSRQSQSSSPGYPHQHHSTSPDYQRQRQTESPDYPRQHQSTSISSPQQPQTYNRRGERPPYPSYASSQTHPHTHDNRPPTYNRQHPIPDQRPGDYDRSSHIYRGHPRHRGLYDRRQPLYDRHSQTLNNRVQSYYNQSRSYDSRASIFSNRIPRPSNNRPSTTNNNGLNGEPDWREAASIKSYSGLTETIKPFYFTKNYANIYGRSNIRHVREGERWLLDQRNEAGDWDKDTARALVALALANNSFPSGQSDYELMKRRFTVQLGVALLRNSSNELKVSRLATAMNALFAVCENPRDFHSFDLAELLRIRIRETVRSRGYPNPFVYLSLCLSEKPATDSEIQHLMKKMIPSGMQDEISKDIQSLAIQAFSCHMQQVSSRDQAYRMSLQEKLNSAVSDLLSRMDEDGSFGSVYSTALAAQALISVNDSRGWNAEKTINFLKQQQREDGSFGDLLATYYALPVLSGRSLLHLRNIQCTPEPAARDLTPTEILEFAGPKQFIHYSIYFGYPLVSSHSLRVSVPERINFLDVMKVAEHQNKNFRFLYETGDKNLNIYSISGTPNDVEQGHAWHLYVKNDADPYQKELQTSEQYNGDVREFFPTANKHMIFWYHPIGLRN